MLHITVIANEKSKEKIQGGGEDIQRQGSFWMKVKERKKKMRCERKDEAVERLNQKLIRADRDELFSDSPRHTLSCSAVWVTLFPFGRQNALSGKSEKEIQ